MPWCLSHRFDPAAKALADRHYNRQKPDSPQFVPPGACLVLLTECARAFWEVDGRGCGFWTRKNSSVAHPHGWTYLKRGFRIIGRTKGGLLALGIDPGDMPPPCPAKPRSMRGAPLFDSATEGRELPSARGRA